METRKKSLTRKFIAPLAAGLLLACSAMVVILVLALLDRERATLESKAQSDSKLMIESLSFAMSNGVTDVSPIEGALRGFEGIKEFRLIPLAGVSTNSHQAPDEVEKAVFASNAESIGYSSAAGSGRALRVTEPMRASASCVACHPSVAEGQVIAVTSTFLSTDSSALFIGRFILKAVVLTLAATIILTLLVGMIIRFVVIHPLRRMRDLVADIAEGQGDLTKRVQIASRDEIGEVAGLVNVFVERTQEVVRGIRSFASTNVGNADALGRAAERTRDAMTEAQSSIKSTRSLFSQLKDENGAVSVSTAGIVDRITALSHQIDGQANAVEQASTAIRQMSASIESVARLSSGKLTAANQLLDITRKGGEKVAEVNEGITAISTSVSDIAEAITLINGIAAKTSLLSMNAAIEAAHAGQYGAGFAVVADEIRILAESSSKNAKRVTAVLKDIIAKISRSLGASGESSESLSVIGKEMGELVAAFAEITASTGELAEGGREILKVSESLMQVTTEIRGGSLEMGDGAERINGAQREIARFCSLSSNAMEDVASRAEAIHGEVGEMAALSIAGRDLGHQLEGAVGRFIVNEGS